MVKALIANEMCGSNIVCRFNPCPLRLLPHIHDGGVMAEIIESLGGSNGIITIIFIVAIAIALVIRALKDN